MVEILLPSLQMRVTDLVPNEFRERAEYTLKRLKLRDGERVLQWREGWYQAYLDGLITLAAGMTRYRRCEVALITRRRKSTDGYCIGATPPATGLGWGIGRPVTGFG
jgi:hypothetical protein